MCLVPFLVCCVTTDPDASPPCHEPALAVTVSAVRRGATVATALVLGCHSPAGPAAASHDSGAAIGNSAGASSVSDELVIRDGDEYSIVIPAPVRSCITFPPALFRSAWCPP